MTQPDRLPLRPSAELAIIGGGVMGLGLAYQLARQGLSDVVVLEAHHLAWGASGRNGGGVRQQWGTELYIRLMQESLAMCRDFAHEMGINIWMRPGGYLFLTESDERFRRMQESVALQRRLGLDTRILEPKEARTIVPDLVIDGIQGASYNPSDAIVFPWPFLWGYARAATERGVQIHTHTPVEAIAHTGSGFVLTTRKGNLRARRVVNTAGAWSPQVARMVGLKLPTRPARHEILSTEPLRPFLSPLVAVLDSGLYFSQSLRGEIVGGITPAEPPDDHVRLGSRLGFAVSFAAALLKRIPRLGRVRVVRQWAGPYDLSPDGSPIVGESAKVPGFFLCCGFAGHGFMLAPVVTRYYASWLLGGTPHAMFTAWAPTRTGSTACGNETWNIG